MKHYVSHIYSVSEVDLEHQINHDIQRKEEAGWSLKNIVAKGAKSVLLVYEK